MNDGSLSADQRREALRRLADDKFDVLVIGGGVTGAGIALDAVTRGLSVALVEKRDYAAGTSSRSSKLLHGGLRYLEQRDFALVREALHERSLILNRLAPHLARPIRFVFPLRHGGWERAYVGAGIALYDVLSGAHPALPRHRHLSRAAALRLAPALRATALRGAIAYYDAQVDDARFVLAVLRTASAHGAVVANGVAVTDLVTDHGRVAGAMLADVETGTLIRTRARAVINAAGVWAPAVERMAGVAEPLQVRASKGVHVLVPRKLIRSQVALILRTEKSVLFVLPWAEHWIIGTTDTPYDLDRDNPTASATDVRYLLDQANRVLRDRLTEADVVGAYAGLRPLVEPPDIRSDTTRISREHLVRHSAPGLVTIAGGKFTTYRVMAKDAVAAAAAELSMPVDDSVTEHIPLVGSVGLRTARHRAMHHPGTALMAPATLDRLIRRYGASVPEVLDLIHAEPQLVEPLPNSTYLAAEAVHAVVHEGALHIEDVLVRRTRLSIEATDRGHAAATRVGELLTTRLGWNPLQQQQEVDFYHAYLDAERPAPESVEPGPPVVQHSRLSVLEARAAST